MASCLAVWYCLLSSWDYYHELVGFGRRVSVTLIIVHFIVPTVPNAFTKDNLLLKTTVVVVVVSSNPSNTTWTSYSYETGGTHTNPIPF